MSTEKIRKIARIYALQNAIQFNGKANKKAVTGKVIAALNKEGFSPKEIIPIVDSVVEKINQIPLNKQISELKKDAPHLLEKEKKERDFSLPELPNAEKGKVVTRFPPEPNGYLHIGHAKAAIIDYEYAKKYDGKFILRFDDTNPENVQLEFYDAQKEDIRWLGIEWDEEYNTSDHIEKHYRLAEQLIRHGDAYICTCNPKSIKEGRFQAKPCNCRNRRPDESLDIWKELIVSSESKDAILRLRGDMRSSNTAMRDPTLFRIIDKPHPLQGDKYRVWPTYDFAGAVEDSISGVTHPFRTKEYELRDPVYFHILSLLNLRKPNLMEFARLSIDGMPVSKRKIKPLIDKKLVSGYDDIRLPTLRGLKKRGIIPEAIKQFVISQGISKVESKVTFSLVESFNRKVLDPKARRYFFVPDPIRLNVKNAPNKVAKLKLHPTFDFGERIIQTKSTFFVPRNDIKSLKVDDVLRLKDLYNVKIKEIGKDVVDGEYISERLLPYSPKVQWTTDDHIEMKVLVPDLLFKKGKYDPNSLKETRGFGEKNILKLKNGEIVQFERFGFVRIEKKQNKIIGFFTHK